MWSRANTVLIKQQNICASTSSETTCIRDQNFDIMEGGEGLCSFGMNSDFVHTHRHSNIFFLLSNT